MSLDATVGGANSNSYLIETDATDLVPQLVSPTVLASWLAASVPTRENALIKASRALNTLEWRFPGIRTNVDTQALCWPRSAVLTVYRRLLDQNVIPQEVLWAVVIYAALDVSQALDITGEDNFSGITHERAGSVEASYVGTQRARGWARAPQAVSMLQPLMFTSSAGAYRL
jgi:hypothetical protein